MAGIAVNVETAERMAIETLDTIWAVVSGQPRRIPVDPITIAHELGIDVFIAEMDPEVSGSLSKLPGRDPAIRLNRSDHTHRVRFSCAHELGHFVLRNGDEVLDYVDYRDSFASTGQSPEERFANRFAAALLMPADEVRKRYRQDPSAAALAWDFKVSADAMRFRLVTLGLA